MKITADRRTLKTRKALNEALFSLMLEKDYESIAVQEILDRADIGRSTFYTHFRDKNELLVDGLQGLEEFLNSARVSVSANSAHSYEKVIGFSLAMFEHAHDHQVIYRSLAGGHGWTIVRRHLEAMLVKLMKQHARPLYKNAHAGGIPFDLFIAQIQVRSATTWGCLV